MELRICQSLFDRQAEVTRRVVEGISNTHVCDKNTHLHRKIENITPLEHQIPIKFLYSVVLQINHMRSLTDFVETQACYFDQCSQHSQELQKQLARFVFVNS